MLKEAKCLLAADSLRCGMAQGTASDLEALDSGPGCMDLQLLKFF